MRRLAGAFAVLVLALLPIRLAAAAGAGQQAEASGPCASAVNASGNAVVSISCRSYQSLDAKGRATVDRLEKQARRTERQLERGALHDVSQDDRMASLERRLAEQDERMAFLKLQLATAVQTTTEIAAGPHASPSDKGAAQSLAAGDARAGAALLGRRAEAALNASDRSRAEAAFLYVQQSALLATRDLAAALQASERAAEIDPDNLEALGTAGRLALANGKTETALGYFTRARRILSSQPADGPGAAARQRDLAVIDIYIGRANDIGGKQGPALQSYAEADAIYRGLVTPDRGDRQWRREHAMTLDLIGDMQSTFARDTGVARGGAEDDALASYGAALDIRRRLAVSDPLDAAAQRALADSYDHIGDISLYRGNAEMLWNEKLTTVAVAHFRKALDAYRAGANIRQKLAELDPANESTQYALSVSHVKYAGVERARGDIAAALLSYRAAIDIRQRLAAGRPDAYGASLASLRFLVGDLYGDQGKPAAAIASYRTGVGIPRARVANDPNDSQSQLDMVYGLRRIGGTEAGRGDIAAALKANREALAIVAKFAVADPRNENLRREANAVAHEIERLERRRRGEPDPPRRAFAFPVDALPESFWRLAPGADNLGAARARDVKVPQGDDTGEPTH